uniref:30S ribosomal protein S15 n=1 Tax=Chloropicon laureae TaxID=464258 RepID=A0A7S2Z1K2_9CHLO|mmetsp:Transcript_1836/g.4697  ORF Transcript_1836/g.4697 Transcript_1836/m.4697 type:complete len:137 (+) Transcript_1836:93-503(+)|eukprot:CAMPEP_0197492624 /NCGR_PEP_ID=MMETSP1311-20131121/12056_1 /TAXON_ID=464262 /ORGANISM="Genus nov. species nov., Strain RCC856" /LENGTH=136 /DNA_ID=CAMNT_0043037645 /DNA_START=68 /DNA_END=478 /DNA_ORIENTATION=+
MRTTARGLAATRATAPAAARVSARALARRSNTNTRSLVCRGAKGTYNTSYAGTEEYKRHDGDVGSSEYQIARLSTRIKQLTEHLKTHKTDHATRRGLMALLNQRNTLLQYLFKNDRATYTATIEGLGIRSRLADKL